MNLSEMTPPNNILAEQQILSSMLLNKESMYNLIADLSPDDFYNNTHSKIYECIRKFQTSDISVIATHVPESEMILSELLDISAFRDVSKSVDEVRGFRCRRDIISSCWKALSAAQSDFEHTPEEIANEHHSNLFQSVRSNDKFVPKLVSEILPSVHEELSQQFQKKERSGIITGLDSVDEDLFIDNGDFILLGARPSMGKSALVSCITRFNAFKRDKSVAVFSLEMRASTQLKRDLFAEAGCSLFEFNKGIMPKAEIDKLNRAYDPFLDSKYWLDCEPGITPIKLRSKINFIKANSDLDLVVIDYAQLMRSDIKTSSERERVSYVALAVNDLAKEFGIPFIVLSQLSRALESRTDKRPQLSDLIESGTLEAAADTVLFLYRDEKYNRNTEKKNVAEVLCAKQRNGRSEFRKEIYFDKRTMNFRNLETNQSEKEEVDSGCERWD